MIAKVFLLLEVINLASADLFRRYSNDEPLIIPTKHTTEGYIADFNIAIKSPAGIKNVNWKLPIYSYCDHSFFFYDNDDAFSKSLQMPKIRNDYLTSTLAFADDAQNFKFGGYLYLLDRPIEADALRGLFCVKAPTFGNELLISLFRPFKTKTISFWFDTSVTAATLQQNLDTQTGEVIFGGVNQQRFVPNSGHVFKLKNLFDFNDSPNGWVTNDLVTILIQGKEGGARRNVYFDIGELESIVPQIMYDALVFQLKSVLVYPLSRKYNLNGDNTNQINEYSGARTNPEYFPCEHAQKLRSFKLNDIVVLKEYLFKRVSGNDCVLTVIPQTNPEDRELIIGFGILKHFHLQVTFNKAAGSTLTISQRS